MAQQYIPVNLVIEALKKELNITEVRFNVTTKTNKRGDVYNQIHFTREDNSPICKFVYCRMIKNKPYVLAASFKEAMTKRDTYIEEMSAEDLRSILF